MPSAVLEGAKAKSSLATVSLLACLSPLFINPVCSETLEWPYLENADGTMVAELKSSIYVDIQPTFEASKFHFVSKV